MTLPAPQPKASHFVGGYYIEDTSGDEIAVIYPFTGEQIASVHAATDGLSLIHI